MDSYWPMLGERRMARIVRSICAPERVEASTWEDEAEDMNVLAAIERGVHAEDAEAEEKAKREAQP